jgi:cation:H+ antiporter
MILFLQVAGGLILLFFGGEYLVRGAVALADRLGVSHLLIGLTVVAAGTSAPELVVCLIAALRGEPGIALGNVVGSNIANILLILGVTGIICAIPANRMALYRDGLAAVFATVLFAAMSMSGIIGRADGALMLVCLVSYLIYCYRSDRRSTAAQATIEAEIEELGGRETRYWVMGAKLAGGLAGVLIGSELLVTGARETARIAGVEPEIIGLSMVAIGTSLPELATGIAAARQKHTDLALGNVLGSNIFNVLAIMGVVALVRPLAVPDRIVAFDLWAMVGITVGFVGFALLTRRIGRHVSLVFLLLYIGYVIALFTGISALGLAHTG